MRHCSSANIFMEYRITVASNVFNIFISTFRLTDRDHISEMLSTKRDYSLLFTIRDVVCVALLFYRI